MTTPILDRPTCTIKLQWPLFTFSFRLSTARLDGDRTDAIRALSHAIVTGVQILADAWKPQGKKPAGRA